MENGIEEIKLPDCDSQEKLNIFVSLEQLNLLHNPIWNEVGQRFFSALKNLLS